ncbi:V/A-type H+-transporting ATPase subunit C [Halarchaeum rubridurum]|uniref:A-type ATP synthase subunit C n=1 Tax=Halarchaeum rubridurum TaxID=489911 RepID=A0A830FTA1_9EURY|nr:V-type ATP synthase subunit C [Halarchaeum rubridurum]MBP1954180.1 V/A-type H+-transporting ATPase subunit C [Halarchaeum rubridurum]GGM57952.1 ATP synthase subunit C [Halarchaeum rubridurum]
MNVISRDASNYSYVNARVRSRWALLLDADEYDTLTRMGPSEIARFLGESEYSPEIDALGSRHSGVDLVEHALNRNLARHFDDLLEWSQGTLYDLISRYLRKFDAWNVKTALRGVYSETDAGVIDDDFIRAGEFDDALLGTLEECESVESVVDALAETVFGDPLADALDDYEETGALVPLENAVDRTFYDTLLRGLNAATESGTREFVKFLQAEVDFRNIRNAFRLARSGGTIDPSEYYIEGGRLFEASELASLVENRDELVARLRESRYGDQLGPALERLESADSLIGFEHALDAALLGYADHLSHVFPLSVCPVLAYILAKEREVDNIRAIARGREVGLSGEEIEQELVML